LLAACRQDIPISTRECLATQDTRRFWSIEQFILSIRERSPPRST